MRDKIQTFKEKLYECDQHKKRLLSAKNNLQTMMPLRLDVYEKLDDISMSIIDQMIFRFSKLQDTMGEKIFPAILALNGESVKKMTFIDRLNRLEELELLSKNEWMELRHDRNEIAHEYSFNQDEVVDSINLIYTKLDTLIAIYDGLRSYCYNQFDFLGSK